MTQNSHLRTILSVFLFALLALGGCAANQGAVSSIEPEEECPIQDNDELVLEKVETNEFLQQELEALSKTGDWERGHDLEKDTKKNTVEYDFPIVINKQVEMYLKLFQTKQRKYFKRWLARSGRYLPMIHSELADAGLPLDLAYLAMIESGYNQRAYSRARAVGLWQFIHSTGKLYRLKINRYVDERRDAEKSTRAAVAFLSDLYARFGDWYLAVAAYNAGPGKISYGLRKYKTKDFWQLAKHRYLKLETKRYVPKLIAAIIIAKNPKKYGFDTVQREKPMAYDTLTVGPGLSLKAATLISNGDPKDIRKLNQELRKGVTPANQAQYQLKIPAGSKELAAKNLNRLHSIVSTGYKTHIVKKGETLKRICRRYRINTTTLLKVNNIRHNQLTAGKRLRIPYSTIRYTLLPTDKNGATISSKDSLILHRIAPGETISIIARRYRVPAEMIVAWNGLTSIHKIRAGRQLSLYIDRQQAKPVTTQRIASRSKSAHHQPSDNLITLAGKKKRIASNTLRSAKSNWYTVKSGDSLWTISRKFNVSTSQIKKWNKLKSNLIRPGNKLKLDNV